MNVGIVQPQLRQIGRDNLAFQEAGGHPIDARNVRGDESGKRLAEETAEFRGIASSLARRPFSNSARIILC